MTSWQRPLGKYYEFIVCIIEEIVLRVYSCVLEEKDKETKTDRDRFGKR